MDIEINKKLATEEEYDYLRNLQYNPSNIPNVSVHYGDVRAMCIEKLSSAYVSPDTVSFNNVDDKTSYFQSFSGEGYIQSFSKQPENKILQYDIPIVQPTELKNETTRKVYVKLENVLILDEKVGDFVLHYKPMIESNLVLDN